MNRQSVPLTVAMVFAIIWSAWLNTQQASASSILIHMKNSLAEDDAQICAVPNVA